MLTVLEAENIVLSNLFQPKIECVDLLDSLNRVLAENIVADRPFPPFNRVTMDGIAINAQVFRSGNRTFNIENIAPAGKPQVILQDFQHCVEVMTGAILPQNADAVVRYEDLRIENGIAEILIENIQIGQNIHAQGQDRKLGERILKSGVKISPAEIGIMATVGKSQVKVYSLPKIAVVSTGDELVAIQTTPDLHQIRISNAYTLAAMFKTWGVDVQMKHLNDTLENIETGLQEALVWADAIVLSGGVSAGKFDFIPQVLETLGVKKHFHRVAQRPGKPFWFGTKGKTCVFALPGNPVSTLACASRYIQPWIRASLALPMLKHTATLLEDITFNPQLTYLLQVKIIHENDTIGAMPVEGGGSGDLANLCDADAFLELPPERTQFYRGESFPVFFYRTLD